MKAEGETKDLDASPPKNTREGIKYNVMADLAALGPE